MTRNLSWMVQSASLYLSNVSESLYVPSGHLLDFFLEVWLGVDSMDTSIHGDTTKCLKYIRSLCMAQG